MILGTGWPDRGAWGVVGSEFSVKVWAMIGSQNGTMDPEILNFQVIMALKEPEITN